MLISTEFPKHYWNIVPKASNQLPETLLIISYNGSVFICQPAEMILFELIQHYKRYKPTRIQEWVWYHQNDGSLKPKSLIQKKSPIKLISFFVHSPEFKHHTHHELNSNKCSLLNHPQTSSLAIRNTLWLCHQNYSLKTLN